MMSREASTKIAKSLAPRSVLVLQGWDSSGHMVNMYYYFWTFGSHTKRKVMISKEASSTIMKFATQGQDSADRAEL